MNASRQWGRVNWGRALHVAATVMLGGCQERTSEAVVFELARDCTNVPIQFSTGEHPPAWSPDGAKVAAVVAYNPNGEFAPGFYLTEIASRSWSFLAPLAEFKSPRTMDWSPQGDRLLVSYDPGADVIDVGTGVTRPLQDADGERIFDARWSPEGDSIWYRRTGGMFVMAASGGGHPRLFHVFEAGFRPRGWCFSPDGTKLAFASLVEFPDGRVSLAEEICSIRRDGLGLRQLTSLGGVARDPRWIHGGSEILFDWMDTTCTANIRRPERTWLALDASSGRLRSLGQYLGSARYQFSFPLGVDRAGERAAVVGKGRAFGSGVEVGVLFWTPIERPLLQRLFRPGSPHEP